MSRTRRIIYWLATLVLASGLVGSGVQQLLRIENKGAVAPPYAWGIVELGYPVYILTILGTWKLLGAVMIVIPKYPLFKEWAYAGLFFLLTGALFSHVAAGSAWLEWIPAIFLLVLTVVSWYLRPADRKLPQP
ncbi:DoxX family protein [Nonomuraea sp. NPDC050790]|uniref:DoxX family protein n=1 Tax=Nonomuraea sp. NPDC050790 TaxID=3364371 RepID=UPI0037889123